MECRAFERDLAGNAAALRSLEPPEAAYTALRARVMDAVRPPRRGAAWWWLATAAAAAIAVVSSLAEFQPQPLPPPATITYRVPAPEFAFKRTEQTPTVVRRATHNMRWSDTQQRSEVAAIKLLTDDPNVVIIWLPNEEANKKGGS
jgi:hypothetical protein